jgi:two-component system response regulator DctR
MSLLLDPRLGLPVVYLVGAEDPARDALSWLLRTRRLRPEPFASADHFGQFLAARPQPWPVSPSCLLLDIHMPDTSGLVLFERLLEQHNLISTMPVIFLMDHGDVPPAGNAAKHGTFDFVEKPCSDNALADRIEQALTASAEALLKRRDSQRFNRQQADLTDRERDVTRLVVEGRANKVIAEVQHTSGRTGADHRARAFEKMGVSSAVEPATLLQPMGA